MTIAMCYISPEGVVLGADSAASYAGPEGLHYLNNAQKLFEIGTDATLGMLIWGTGSLPETSYRTHIALLGDALAKKPAKSVEEVANRWIDLLWPEYMSQLSATILRARTLAQMPPFDPQNQAPDPAARTREEEHEYAQLLNFGTGFCIGGYVMPDRKPGAYVVVFSLDGAKPVPQAVQGLGGFWGAPNTIQRLISGADPGLTNDILASGKWSGTADELVELTGRYALDHPMLPIRDAIDFVHACIYSTIKAHKFSNLSQICGGPIEIAVIRTDRQFQWVEHKPWDAAIKEGAFS